MSVVYSDDDITITLEYFSKLKGYVVHTKVSAWSLSKYKKYLLIVGKLLVDLDSKNITEIYAIPPSEKEEHWQKLFGFKDSGFRLGEYKIMRLDNGN